MQHYLFFDPLEVQRSTQYPKSQELNYSHATEVGNWFEERLGYKKNNFKHTTSYSNHYTPKPYSRISPDLIWSEKFKAEGVDPLVHSKLGCWDYPNFFENFSTTYDLSFNHYPKWYKNHGHIERKLRFRMMQYEPQDDYIQSFDNITRSGLVEKKKEDWCIDKWGSYTTHTTHNQDTFKPPTLEDYKFIRHAPPKCNSIKLYPPNQNAGHQKWRDRIPAYSVVPNFELVQVPRPLTCNPITSECPKKYPKKCEQ